MPARRTEGDLKTLSILEKDGHVGLVFIPYYWARRKLSELDECYVFELSISILSAGRLSNSPNFSIIAWNEGSGRHSRGQIAEG
ncbi:hypothetical protein VTN49DRAFT_800 [Thermomyces lanuginosus]|uniref:uncharacterized protein n=1 Tax=Thermomyces lanuginosus TaxID=5541 RepID=UPI003743C4B2